MSLDESGADLGFTVEPGSDQAAPPSTLAESDPWSGPLIVLGDLCTGCGECVEICPADAIEVML